mmetsp:Transcript_29984/g.44442  ORF Transcript_29984/g.44442 Transcript_29984/m.44442 type:complete len:93 (+) Transcript_29984:83-361(+)
MAYYSISRKLVSVTWACNTTNCSIFANTWKPIIILFCDMLMVTFTDGTWTKDIIGCNNNETFRSLFLLEISPSLSAAAGFTTRFRLKTKPHV